MPVPKQFLLPESEAVLSAMSGLSYAFPFWASYAYERMRIHTLTPEGVSVLFGGRFVAGTDGTNIYISDAAFAAMPIPERIGVLAHEIEHDMLGHAARGFRWRTLGYVPVDGKQLPYDQRTMNDAMDAEINAGLLHFGLKLPANRVELPWVDPHEMTCEHIYARLIEENPPQPQPGEGEGEGEGEGGAGGAGDPSEGDEPSEGGHTAASMGATDSAGFDVHMTPAAPETSADEAGRAQALQNAVAAGMRAGNVPGKMKKLVETLNTSEIDWVDELRDAMTTTLGFDSLDFLRMNRRHHMLIGGISPARRSERVGTLAFVFDTSGSVWDFIPRMLTEVADVVENCRPRRVVVLWTDTNVQRVDDFDEAMPDDVRSLEVPGGGGTDLRAGFRWVEEEAAAQGDVVAGVVCLTDSLTPWPGDDEEPDYPVITATSGPDRRHPRWMRVVGLPKD